MTHPTQSPGPAVGLRHSETMRVEERHTVPEVADWSGFADMPPVFATAMMVGFIEHTCVMGLVDSLGEGQQTVGTHVDVSHTAATPVGMSVTAEVELLEVNRRNLLFRVSAYDDSGPIGEGTHRRAIIDTESFLRRLDEKSTKASAG